MASYRQSLAAQYALDFNAQNNLQYIPSSATTPSGLPTPSTFSITYDVSNNPTITFTMSEYVLDESGIVIPNLLPIIGGSPSSDASWNVVPVVTSVVAYRQDKSPTNSNQYTSDISAYTNESFYATQASGNVAQNNNTFNSFVPYKITLSDYDLITGYAGFSKYALVTVKFYNASQPTNIYTNTKVAVTNNIGTNPAYISK